MTKNRMSRKRDIYINIVNVCDSKHVFVPSSCLIVSNLQYPGKAFYCIDKANKITSFLE